ncbi:hypothetical protein BVX97_05265 [bacterium E08(2017)]|nr:hypothetical protein BVX97_05265 [bacterium E08(2017)]
MLRFDCRVLFRAVVVMLMSAQLSHAAYTVNWSDTTFASPLYDSDDTTDVSGTADWVFQLIVDTGNNTDVGSMISSSDWEIGAGHTANNQNEDFVLDTGNWVPSAGGWFNDSVNVDPSTAAAGSRLYVRFFNSSSLSTATHVGFIYDDGTDSGGRQWLTPADLGNATLNLDRDGVGLAYTQGTGSNADGWATTIAVPEPGTIALMLMGIMTLGAGGLRRKKD